MSAEPDKGWDYHGGADDPIERLKRMEAEKLAKVDPKLREVYTERMEKEQKVTETLSKLIALAEAGSHLSRQELFDSLWYDERKRNIHIERRVNYGHITDKADYIVKTFDAIAGATVARLAGEDYIELELDDKKWSIVINGDGKIKTSYLHDKRFKSFVEINRVRNQDKEMEEVIYETAISERVRAILKRLFGAR